MCQRSLPAVVLLFALGVTMRVVLLLCVIFAIGCGQLPTSPSPAPTARVVVAPPAPTTPAPILCVSGQSNAYKLLPFLGTPTAVTYGGDEESLWIGFRSPTAQGWAIGGQTIYYWLAYGRTEGPGWLATAPFLTPACGAFLWAQGEADEDLLAKNGVRPGDYTATLTTLLADVRAQTSASLPVLIVQLAPRYPQMRAEQAAACAADRACRMVPTDDLTFPDGTHLDDAGYRALAQRIVGLVR